MTTLPDFTTLRTTLFNELNRVFDALDHEQLGRLRAELLQAPRIFIAGKGRSGLAIQAFAMRLMHLGCTVHIVGDITTPNIRAGDVLLIGSGSGRTPSLVQYALRAHEIGARVVLITGADTSPIHEIAVCIVHIAASTPKLGTDYDQSTSSQPMGSLFEQTMLLLLDLLIIQLMVTLDQDPDRMFSRHANLE